MIIIFWTLSIDVHCHKLFQSDVSAGCLRYQVTGDEVSYSDGPAE
jgi:hypothetical protein